MYVAVAAILGGIFSICGGVFDWNFFFTSYRARRLVSLFGRDGARIFYIIMGTALVALGVIAIIFPTQRTM